LSASKAIGSSVNSGQPQVSTRDKRSGALPEGEWKEATQGFEKIKMQIRAQVEHCFGILKNLVKYRKVRSRGLAKNTAQLHTLFALANLILARRSFAQRVY